MVDKRQLILVAGCRVATWLSVDFTLCMRDLGESATRPVDPAFKNGL